MLVVSASDAETESQNSRAGVRDPPDRRTPELNYEEGNIEVKFRLDIGNRAGIPIKLSRLEIVTVNPDGGAYTLDSRHRAYYFNKTIDPHQNGTVEFWAKAYGYGRSPRENEPVTVRGTLYYETPNGYLQPGVRERDRPVRGTERLEE